MTPELDVNHSITYDDETDSWCCCPACAEGVRRFYASERIDAEMARQAVERAKVDSLIRDAAEASERFGEDECEAWAAQYGPNAVQS